MLRVYSTPASRLLDLYNDFDLFLGNQILLENGTLTLEVPGFSKKDLTVEVDQKESLITITGEKEISGKTRKINKSIRDYRLRNIDLKKIEAKVEDGILYIDLKEAEEKIKETKRVISLN
jgi:HSP20 family molecular chaperone IbpA